MNTVVIVVIVLVVIAAGAITAYFMTRKSNNATAGASTPTKMSSKDRFAKIMEAPGTEGYYDVYYREHVTDTMKDSFNNNPKATELLALVQPSLDYFLSKEQQKICTQSTATNTDNLANLQASMIKIFSMSNINFASDDALFHCASIVLTLMMCNTIFANQPGLMGTLVVNKNANNEPISFSTTQPDMKFMSFALMSSPYQTFKAQATNPSVASMIQPELFEQVLANMEATQAVKPEDADAIRAMNTSMCFALSPDPVCSDMYTKFNDARRKSITETMDQMAAPLTMDIKLFAKSIIIAMSDKFQNEDLQSRLQALCLIPFR